MLEQRKSYKLKNGRLVERTPEEMVRLNQLRAEAQRKSAKPKLTRTTDRFARITLTQIETLLQLNHVCWPLFTILQLESFRLRGAPFALPAKELLTVKGLSRANLHRALARLERGGLISIQRAGGSKPPTITVPEPLGPG